MICVNWEASKLGAYSNVLTNVSMMTVLSASCMYAGDEAVDTDTSV